MSTSNSTVIEAQGLYKSFEEIKAVQDLSFAIPAGKVLGLLGPNGAGKTTAVKMLTTLLPIDQGSASIAGFDVAERPEAVRRVIGLAGQSAAVDEKLTPRENLELFSWLYKIPRKERRARIEGLIDRFDMTEFADRPVAKCSGGQRRRLDVVAALVAQPQALFLDEPTTGLDPRSRSELWDAVQALAAEGTAILLTSQYLEEADRLSDHVIVLDKGREVAAGSPEALKKRMGQDVLEIHVSSEDDRSTAVGAVTESAVMTSVAGSQQLDINVEGGAAQSLQLLRRIDDAGVSIVDFQLRRPTLDDVFLALTGAPTSDSGVTPS
ncbi:MAG: ATP-binding cassette domain-containing protein [bacterium]|nr:ATP-binding cassette domain-containing protein [bacterium]